MQSTTEETQQTQQQVEEVVFEIKVKGISFKATKEDVLEHLNTFTKVENINLIVDRDSGRHKGFAYVRVADQQALDDALANNKTEHMGRYLEIEKAQKKSENTGDRGSYRGRGGNNNYRGNRGGYNNNRDNRDNRDNREERPQDDENQLNETQSVFVGNLSFDTGIDALRDVFSNYGDIQNIKIVQDQETGRSKGFAFIDFSTNEEAKKALVFSGDQIDGRNIKVDLQVRKSGQRSNRGGNRGGYRGRGDNDRQQRGGGYRRQE